jgi:hypothetical protein
MRAKSAGFTKLKRIGKGEYERVLGHELRNLHIRSQVLHAIRDFFFSEGFTEVETPVRIPAPALRRSSTPRLGPRLAEGLSRAPHERLWPRACRACIRSAPVSGGRVRQQTQPGVYLLEWYRAGASYTDILKDTEALVTHVSKRVRLGLFWLPRARLWISPGPGIASPCARRSGRWRLGPRRSLGPGPF